MPTWSDVDPAEITPEPVYRHRKALGWGTRRTFGRRVGGLTLAAAGAAAAAALAAARRAAAAAPAAAGATPGAPPHSPQPPQENPADTPNTLEQITNYNNYYEFTTDKEGVAQLARGFKADPWSVAVGGLVNKPQ